MRFIVFGAITLAVVLVAAEDILKEEDEAKLNDEQYFQELYSCMIEKTPCSDDMAVYKERIPGYLKTNCGTCSQEEKKLFEKLVKVVAEKYPKEFKELMDKLSPKAQ